MGSSSGTTKAMSIPSIAAVHEIRRMRGGAQAHLMQCSDRHFYIVKFRNNPQNPRILANELLASWLAEHIGIPVPPAAVVEVDESLIEEEPALRMQLPTGSIPCEAGLHFGSRYVAPPLGSHVFDYIPVEFLPGVQNLRDFLGVLVLDKWLGNTDARQAVFWKMSVQRKYSVSFIDHGYCFNSGDWNFPDYPLRGVYAQNEVYEAVRGWDSFEPWLSRVEGFNEEYIWEMATDIPPVWYGSSWIALEALVRTLIERRSIVRGLIEAFRRSPRHPFPHWNDSPGQSSSRARFF